MENMGAAVILLWWCMMGTRSGAATAISRSVEGVVSAAKLEGSMSNPSFGPFISIETSRHDPLPITSIDVSCGSSNGTHFYGLALSPSASVSLFPSTTDPNEMWSCSFTHFLTSEKRSVTQGFYVYTAKPNPYLMPLPCEKQICLWTVDNAGFNLYSLATHDFVQVHTWL